MKISKRLREQAADLCAQMASWWAVRNVGESWGASPVLQEERASKARRLAESMQSMTTFTVSPDSVSGDYARYVVEWAEAEAMLRTGWTP
jgi:hypothetical protein